MKKQVYMSFSSDVIHHGHVSIIQKAAALGDVTIGIMVDSVIREIEGEFPILNYEQRENILSNIKGVIRTIPQYTLLGDENIASLKPEYIVHGDDWKTGLLSDVRLKTIGLLKQWKGELVEFPYTRGEEVDSFIKKLGHMSKMPEIRRKRLSQLLKAKDMVRVLEAHNGLTALIVQNSKDSVGEETRAFDAIWISSLCDSTAKGKPDIELVDMTSRFNTLNEIMEVTSLPIILDGDTGGIKEHFSFNVQTLERLGISAVIIEDKTGLKRNSLFGTEVEQVQDTIENFSEKILAGVSASTTQDFMIIARIESLVLGQGVPDALIRAKAYTEAGARGIMIHSKDKRPDQVFQFIEQFRAYNQTTPLIVVPTTYNTVTEDEFKDRGVNMVIYANHLIRSAYPAMKKTAESILKYGRSFEADNFCMDIKDIINLIPNK